MLTFSVTFYNKCIFCRSFSTEQIQVAVLHVKASHFSGWSSNVVAYFLLHLKKETSLLLKLRSSAPLTLLISTSDLSNHLSSRQTSRLPEYCQYSCSLYQEMLTFSVTFYNKCIFCRSFSTEQIQVAVLHVKASHFSGWSSNVVAYFLLHLKKETSLLLKLRSSAPLTLLISTSDLSNHLSSRQTWVSRRHGI